MKKRTLITSLLTVAIIILATIFMNKSNNFDWLLLIILSIVSFLILYKIFNYVANFKTIENKSRIDIFFLFIFFVWLFIPMSHITKNDFCTLERRPRKELQGLFKNNEINYEFGKDFNEWFDDRFFLRDDLIKLYNQLSLLILDKNTKGFIDRDWIYMNGSSNNPTYNDFNALVKLNSFCNLNGIKLYVLIVPGKNDIYFSKKTNVLINKTHENFLKFLTQYNDKVSIIYPYNQLLKNKDKEYMYFKTDPHWTDNGAFIGYSELMKVIKKDFPNIKTQTFNDYNYFENNLIRTDFRRRFVLGTTCSYVGLSKKQSKKYHKTKYKYFKHKNYNLIKNTIIHQPYKKQKLFYFPYGNNYRAIMMGTSMNENLSEFIPYSFKNTKYIRLNGVISIDKEDTFKIMKYYKNEILEYKPDILIFCITKDNMTDLHNLFEE